MTTITGKIENSAGETLHAKITFTSRSTPQFGAGIVQTNTVKTIKSDPATGEFEILLAAGNYAVSTTIRNVTTSFTIAVPEGDDTFSIEDLVSSSVSEIPGDPPNELWNGTRKGHITFDPIANAPAIAAPSVVTYSGGSIANGNTYLYAVSYVTQDGETTPENTTTVTPSTASNKALRLALVVSPTRVTSKRIWRNKTEGDDVLYLLATVGPEVATYDDYESHTLFAARASVTIPTFNTTAGIIHAVAGEDTLYFSTTGLRCLVDAQFDGLVHAESIHPSPISLGAGTAFLLRGGNGQNGGGDITIIGGGGGDSIGGDVIIRGGGGADRGSVLLGQFSDDTVIINGVLSITQDAAAGYVLTSDADGIATWQAAAGGGGVQATTGDPEGVKNANAGQWAYDASASALYLNPNTSGTSGWIRLI